MITLAALLMLAPVSRAELASPECQKTLTTLTQDQRTAVRQATGRGFSIRVFVKHVGKSLRTVVLAGEQHEKSADHAQAGDVLTGSFRHQAFERGHTFNAYWFSGLLGRFHDLLTNSARQTVGLEDQTHGSSMIASDVAENSAALETQLLPFIARQVRDGQMTAEAAAEGLAQVVRSMKVVYEQDGKRVEFAMTPSPVEQLRERITEAAAATTESEAPTLRPPEQARRTYNLEEGYQPSIFSNVNALFAVASYKMSKLTGPVKITLGALAAAGSVVALVATREPATWAAAGIAVPFFALQLAIEHGLRRGAMRFYDRRGRDRNMARALEQVLIQNDEATEVLALVGWNHVRGIARHMRRRGYTETTLEAYDDSSGQPR